MAHRGNLPTISIRSFNYQDRYIRHRKFVGELTPVESDLDKHDATWRQPKPSLGDWVAFRSSNFTGFRLRHQDFALALHEEMFFVDPERPPSYLTPEGELFYADSSFQVVPGLANNDGWVSFKSLNYPDRCIRHRDFKLYLEPAADDLARADSTFQIVSGFVPGPPIPDLH